MNEILNNVKASLFTTALQYSHEELAWDCGPLLDAVHVAIGNAADDQVLTLVSEIYNRSNVSDEVRNFYGGMRQHLAQLLCDQTLEAIRKEGRTQGRFLSAF